MFSDIGIRNKEKDEVQAKETRFYETGSKASVSHTPTATNSVNCVCSSFLSPVIILT